MSDARRAVTSGEFVMVAVDEGQHPEPILWKPEAVQLAAEAHQARSSRA